MHKWGKTRHGKISRISCHTVSRCNRTSEATVFQKKEQEEKEQDHQYNCHDHYLAYNCYLTATSNLSPSLHGFGGLLHCSSGMVFTVFTFYHERIQFMDTRIVWVQLGYDDTYLEYTTCTRYYQSTRQRGFFYTSDLLFK